jgi:hypothetical protein
MGANVDPPKGGNRLVVKYLGEAAPEILRKARSDE